MNNTRNGWENVLEFWFSGDVKTLSNAKWFPSQQKQMEMDQLITAKFGDLLKSAERRELDDWKEKERSCLALIITLDQFSRHVCRKDKDRIAEIDTLALETCCEFMRRNWHTTLPIPEFIFSIMPLRHNDPSDDRLRLVLDQVKNRDLLATGHQRLLQKFQQATNNRLSHVEHSNTNEEILEHFEFKPDYSTIQGNPLLTSMLCFIEQHLVDSSHIFVSLSGGVDSMVIAQLLVYIRDKKLTSRVFTVVAIHIDYGNRSESHLESDFVQDWCNRHEIVFRKRHISEVKRGVTKRQDYELIARDLRYSYYIQVLNEFNGRGICFGHHRGDVQENIISNLMKGLSLLDLNGMKSIGFVNNVLIFRPLLKFDKTEFFHFAHTYGTPYFKDTTPLWSTRGKMRTKLMPLLIDMYGDGFLHNVSAIGEESAQCKHLVHDTCFQPLFDTIQHSSMAVSLCCREFSHHGVFFWKEILRHVCHQLLGTAMIRDKPMKEFVQNKLSKTPRSDDIESTNGQWVTLKKQNRAFFTEAQVLILFHSSFFQQQIPFDTVVSVETKNRQIGHWIVDIVVQDDEEAVVNPPVTTMWDLVHSGRLEYTLPYAEEYKIVESIHRVASLRKIHKRVIDMIPILTPSKISEIEPQQVLIQLKYTREI